MTSKIFPFFKMPSLRPIKWQDQLKIWLIVFCCLSGGMALGSGVPGKVDSLKSVIQTSNEGTSKVQALNSLAEIYIFSSPDSSLYYAEQALKTAKKLDWLTGIANAYHYIGYAYYAMGNYDQCLLSWRNSLEAHKKKNDQVKAVAALSNLAIVYRIQGDFPKALEYSLEALKIDKKLGDSTGIAADLGSLGTIYYQQKKYSRALEYFEQALKIDEKLENQSQIAAWLGNIAGIYVYQGKYAQAIEYYLKALNLRRESGDKRETATALGNIGSFYTTVYSAPDSLRLPFIREYFASSAKTNNTKQFLLDSAIAFQQRAFIISDEIGDQLGITYRLSTMGDILMQQQKLSAAVPLYRKSYLIADKIGALPQKMNTAENIYRAYKLLNNNDSALSWHERYTNHKDSIFNEKKEKDLGRLEAKAEYDKEQAIIKTEHQAELEKREALAKAESQRQNAIIASISIGLGLVILFAIFLFNRFRLTRRQKDIIEKQRNEVHQQKEMVEEKNKEITDSITYARRLQEAILPPKALVKEWLDDSFILYKPKDIVAGDFYWMEVINDTVYFAAADCTGHGVPGAMVSVVCSHALSKSVIEENITEPAKILDRTRQLVIERFSKSEEEVKDGMDISLCAFNTQTNTISFAGANNPLWIITKRQTLSEYSTLEGLYGSNGIILFDLKADKQPIGKYDSQKPFTNHVIQLEKGDTIYLFSDGYADQFGGEKGKKFKAANFKKLLFSIYSESMQNQRELLDQAFEEWKGEIEQVDDVCIIGVRI